MPLKKRENHAPNNKASDKASNEALNEALSADETVILRLIKRNEKIKQIEIAQQSGFYRAKVQRLMKKLGDEEIIWHEGSKKNGKWCVREDGRCVNISDMENSEDPLKKRRGGAAQ